MEILMDKNSKQNSRVQFLDLDSTSTTDDLGDFSTKKKNEIGRPVIENDEIDRIAKDNNFTSRKMLSEKEPVVKQRRYRTGRNRQFNIKATDHTINEFYRIADIENVPLGEILDIALKALIKSDEKYKV
jgi:hypothetical protein